VIVSIILLRQHGCGTKAFPFGNLRELRQLSHRTIDKQRNDEIQMMNEAQSTNDECCSQRPVAGLAETRTGDSVVTTAAYSGFVIISSFVIRHSSFSAS